MCLAHILHHSRVTKNNCILQIIPGKLEKSTVTVGSHGKHTRRILLLRWLASRSSIALQQTTKHLIMKLHYGLLIKAI